MQQAFDIHKAAGIIIKNRRLLVGRAQSGKAFISPGGRVEPGETAKQALSRELEEELRITVQEADLEDFGTFYAEAANHKGSRVRVDAFIVKGYRGEISPSNEVVELRWIDSAYDTAIPVGSIFAHEVLPRLKRQGLID